MVAAHPVLNDFEMVLVGHRIEHRNLVSAPGAFYFVSVNLFGSSPSFGRTKHDHGPARTGGVSGGARMRLDCANLKNALLENGSRLPMHFGWIVAFNKVWFVAISDQQRFQLLVGNAGKHGRIRDFVAVQVQDR